MTVTLILRLGRFWRGFRLLGFFLLEMSIEFGVQTPFD
jgi:hypothetical protein